MDSIKLKRVKSQDGIPFETESEVLEYIRPFASKFFWFKKMGWEPHIYQTVFHAMSHEGQLCRFRNLVAGRRGGKTISAAWEVLYYALNPAEFHYDAHGQTDCDEPLHIWVLVPDYRSSGRAALKAVRDVLRKIGMEEGRGYRENRGDLYIEFDNGSLIEFKTAERPDKLVGAGLDILWIDEAALISGDEAWNVARPALADKLGIVICTTTPREKNWYYKLFWNERALGDPNIGSVEYFSIHNPYFPAKEWQDQKEVYHPLLFRREYMASFDSMAGVELSGDWLHYFTFEQESHDKDVITIPRNPGNPKKLALRTYIGVDPAVSLAEDADKFAMALVGVTEDNLQVFLLDLYAARIPFHEQLNKIQEWFHKYRPQLIGVESVAYQRVLADQAMRQAGFPGIVPMMAPGKKVERIMAMSPLFRIGKIRIEKTQRDFIDEWLNYDSTKSNPDDDCLDAVEIALRTAGALLPTMPKSNLFVDNEPTTFDEWAWRQVRTPNKSERFDPQMGEHF